MAAHCRPLLLECEDIPTSGRPVQMDSRASGCRLVRRPAPSPEPPRLDEGQQRGVGHHGGPLLVLAGPGTGKTTAIVEAVAHRVTDRGTDPARIVVLTFSRKAADELR